MDRFFDENRANWDERAQIHVRNRTGFYGIEGFRRGEDVLGPIEDREIGDVAGKRLLHLQCHFGLDSLSLARRGAEVTALDFSPVAIEAARALSSETGVAARFVEGNVYDAPDLIEDRFDMVYATWGVICWLPDLRRWAEIIAGFLEPGGVFYFADGHPLIALIEEENGDIVVRYGWGTPKDTPITFDEPVTYTGDDTPLVNRRNNEWNHSLADLLNALEAAGLDVEDLHEHDTLPWLHLPMMKETEPGVYRLPEGAPQIPLSISLKARKPA